MINAINCHKATDLKTRLQAAESLADKALNHSQTQPSNATEKDLRAAENLAVKSQIQLQGRVNHSEYISLSDNEIMNFQDQATPLKIIENVLKVYLF